MDSNVIEFPTRTVRDWIAVQNIIEKNLQQGGASPEMIQEVCARMKESWERLDIQLRFVLELPSLPEELRNIINNSVQKALEGLAKQIHEYSTQVLFDRLLLEIQLFKLRYGE